MNLETNRLATFDNWPSNSPVEPILLARNGFYASGNYLEVECHWCNCRISNWQYGDEVELRHRQEDPHCAFVVNNRSCGNVPINCYNENNIQLPTTSTNITTTATVDQSQQSGDLLIEANRLATFKNWPNPNISPQSLAKAGFFYLNHSDQVKCAWCKGVIAKWEKEDNAFDEHKRFFPDCPRVQLGPLIEMASEGIRDLGIQQISPPKKPKFASLDARIRTYTNWPIASVQRPEKLAQAGLYYQDVCDHVRCFHCNIGLRSWQKEDDPWFEHARWYPQCEFVHLVKGASYVESVLDQTRQSEQPTDLCTPMTLEEAMTTQPVVQALEIGLDDNSIRTATQKQLTTTGRPYSDIEGLLKAVFDDRDDTENGAASNGEQGMHNVDDRPGTSIVREVSRIINSIFGDNDSNNVTTNHVSLPIENDTCQQNITTTSPTPDTTIFTDNLNKISCHNVPSEPEEISEHKPMLNRTQSLEEENRKLKDARLCKVCLDEEVGVVFLPCGHLVTCVQCATGVQQCPMCRTIIKGFVRTYLS